ncbi:hypothetical protein [Methylobacterium komagatae]
MALGRVLENIAAKIQAERGFTAEQVALAMVATGINGLSKAWDGQKVVDFLAGVTGGLMTTHGIEASGEVIPRGRPN